VTALRSAYPQLSPEAIERLLKNTAIPLEAKNPLYAGNLGAGLVNVIGIKEAMESKDTEDWLGRPVFRQAKAFIDLKKLEVASPVKVAPAGRYKNIKFLLQPSAAASQAAAAGLPDIKAVLFKDGASRDTVLKKERLKVPFIVSADSLYLYAAAGKKKGAPPQAAAWWYYEVITVDSSTLFCGNTVTEINGSEGTIEDGSGDLNYTGRNDCKWQITVPEGKKIQLSFEQFDTEPKIDQVYLFNGNSTKDPILAIFSGHTLPPTIKSWGNTVLVWFLTSEENNFKGWKMHYKAIDK
jgi:hypothetical protein